MVNIGDNTVMGEDLNLAFKVDHIWVVNLSILRHGFTKLINSIWIEKLN